MHICFGGEVSQDRNRRSPSYFCMSRQGNHWERKPADVLRTLYCGNKDDKSKTVGGGGSGGSDKSPKSNCDCGVVQWISAADTLQTPDLDETLLR